VARSAPADASRLGAFAIFADLPAAELDELAAAMTEVGVDPSAQVVTVDDFGTGLYFIEEGEDEVHADGEELRTLGPGDALARSRFC
jgi:hypothetical protein